MDDLVQDAVAVVLPFVGGTATLAAEEFAKQSGTGAAEAFRRVVASVWHRGGLDRDDASREHLERALRSALDEGAVTAEDLRCVAPAATTTTTTVTGQNVVYNSSIRIGRGNFTQKS